MAMFTIGSIFYGFLVPLHLGALSHVVLGSTAGQIVACIAVYAGVRLSYCAASPRAPIAGLFFWLFVYLWLGLAPLTEIGRNRFPLDGYYDDGLRTQAALVVAVGVVFYELGRLFSQRRPLVSGPMEWLGARSIDPRRTRTVAVLSILMSLFILATLGAWRVLFSSRDALDQVFQNRAGGDTAFQSLLVGLMTGPLFLSLYLLVATSRRSSPSTTGSSNARPPKQTQNRLLLAALIVMNLAVNNPLSSPRFWYGTVVISLLYLVFVRGSTGSKRFMILANLVVASTIVVFPYADIFRHSVNSSVAVRPLSEQLTEKGDYDSFQQIMNGIRFTDHSGFSLGHQSLLGPLTFFVPRRVWPAKPRDTAILVATDARYKFKNLSSPLWLEGYTDFGYAGVALLLFALGWITRITETLQVSMPSLRTRPSMLEVLLPVFAVYQVFVLRGSLIQATGRGALLCAVGLCCSTRYRDTEETSAIGQRNLPKLSPR